MLRLFLTLLSVGLGILAFPPFHSHPLALVAPIPFLLALRDSKPTQGTLLGLLYGLTLFGGTLNWLLSIFGFFAVLLFFILSIFPTIFGSITATLVGLVPGRRWLPFAVGVLWTGTEYFRSEWFTLRFPWITPGTALPPGYLTPILGVYGVSLLVVTGGACLAFRQIKTGLALLAVVAISIYLPQPAPEEASIKVAAVQGENFPFDNLLTLSERATGDIDAFVWPELAVDPDIRTRPTQLAAVRQLLSDKNASFVTLGTPTQLDGDQWANSAVTIGADAILGVHDKNRPVHFFDDGRPGTETRAIETPLGPIATTVCFDNDYEAIPRRSVKNGAGLFLIPSMDAAHWTARQHLQHAELARHRAAENGRWVVVASSSGLTQVIDPRGRRIAELPLFEPGVVVAEVAFRDGLTPYTRFGWLVGPTCTVLAGALILLSSILSRRKPSIPSDPHP